MYTADDIITPFDNRYASDEMRDVWNEHYKRLCWRKCWMALARAQSPAIVDPEAIVRLAASFPRVDVLEAEEEEKTTKHDLVAELNIFRRQAGEDGRYLHLGATSSDIVENGRALQVQAASLIVLAKARSMVMLLNQAEGMSKGITVSGRTHGQLADPLGFDERLLVYRAEIEQIYDDFAAYMSHGYQSKGFKGSTGVYNGYTWAYALAKRVTLQEGRRLAEVMDRDAMANLGLKGQYAATQVGSKYHDGQVLFYLSALASSLAKLATDMRLLCAFGEIRVTKAEGQVGSSAMPHKSNPIAWENVSSLARLFPGWLSAHLHNWQNNWLERSLDDSANMRILLPEAFMALDEILSKAISAWPRLALHRQTVTKNLAHNNWLNSMAQVADQLNIDETEFEVFLNSIAEMPYEEPDPERHHWLL